MSKPTNLEVILALQAAEEGEVTPLDAKTLRNTILSQANEIAALRAANGTAKRQALQVLREAFAADPVAMDQLFRLEVEPLQQDLVGHPTIICRTGQNGLPALSVLGLINGILCKPGDPERITRHICDHTERLEGFGLYNFERKSECNV